MKSDLDSKPNNLFDVPSLFPTNPCLSSLFHDNADPKTNTGSVENTLTNQEQRGISDEISSNERHGKTPLANQLNLALILHLGSLIPSCFRVAVHAMDSTTDGDSPGSKRAGSRRQFAFYPNMNSTNKPTKPFSRSAAKRESVMALGSIEHLQHYFTKTGIAAEKKYVLCLSSRPPGCQLKSQSFEQAQQWNGAGYRRAERQDK